ncbi:hypothetical protein MED134_14517 [Dokdonia sp. MED134]|uniref:GAF domain-containing protein n=1 Tax=Dokdonia sp. MED134 TaxID=313590 RepID=UPI0001F81566|nr:GAF domain-containing protein [Dokdonia sp. MED134]EAQ37650.2 hypothetical protein MED134_14517 [Dokdonia sp. MED134]
MKTSMQFKNQDFPLDLRFSVEKLMAHYTQEAATDHLQAQNRIKELTQITQKFPELITGISDLDNLSQYQEQIDNLLLDLFPAVLQSNEIKIVSMPFQETVLQSTKRYKSIIASGGEEYTPEITNFDDNHYYIMGCSIILMQYYGYKIDFRRPFYYEIPDASGMTRSYRMLYNGDFVGIEKKPETPEITEEDVAVLLDNFDNIEVWKEKFPSQGYIFKGFVIANLYDATVDVSISNLKSGLLQYDQDDTNFTEDFHKIFQAIFNLPEIQIGFSNYNEQEGKFELVPLKKINSYILYGETEATCTSALCEGSYDAVFKTGKYFAVSDIKQYHKRFPDIKMYENFKDQGIGSVILAPVRYKGNLLGIFELASPNIGELNTINANKLEDVMPYIVEAVVRNKEQQENEIELVIQNECTSIHQSVYWKFEQEAKRFLKLQAQGDANVQFRDVVFKDVYPLFGQIDIKGSSEARNKATQKDILLQLDKAIEILKEARSIESLPIYEQLEYNLNEFLVETKEQLEVDSERKILNFLKENIRPLFSHLLKRSDKLKSLITSYRSQIEDNLGLVYRHRKEYDESVMLLNKRMAAVLEKKQKTAQNMYPHFFELFKTDGVEHNMYLGEAITKDDSFNKIYLYNLRLWQLQVMCEMENEHFSLSRKMDHPLEVASMILVFNTSLSVRYRMDEKRFDVDGTYNARYEVVKKRVDKAYIKGTQERITQAGKITIVYSQYEDEQEYLRYIKFLQTKNYLGSEIEILQLEDLQAVTGLKALRVNVLYAQKKGKAKKSFYTYEDLMEEIKA